MSFSQTEKYRGCVSPSTTNAQAPSPGEWIAPALAWLCTCLLSFWFYRGARVVGFDPYYYLEYAKRFATELPDAFGTHWPFGYPLLGAALVKAGVEPFHALVSVGAGLLLVALLISYRILRITLPPRAAWAFMFAIALAPVMVVELGGLRSEISFSAPMLGAFISLAGWPKPRAVAAGCLCALLAFGIRYAGVLCFFTIGAWALYVTWKKADRRNLFTMYATLALTAAVALGLLWINYRVRGYLSGGERAAGEGIVALPRILADFGWGLIAAFSSTGIVAWAEHHARLYFLAGLACTTATLALAGLAWLRPRSDFSRPLALGSGIYIVGMACLYAYQTFDGLSSARTALPVLLPLAILAGEQTLSLTRKARTAVFALAAAPILLGATMAFRGISREITHDYAPLLAQLKLELKPGQTLAASDTTLGLSAYVSYPVFRYISKPDSNFVVVGKRPKNRAGTIFEWRPEEARLLRECESTHVTVWHNERLVLLKRK